MVLICLHIIIQQIYVRHWDTEVKRQQTSLNLYQAINNNLKKKKVNRKNIRFYAET